MKIKFVKDQFIECCIGFDEDEEPIMEEEEVLTKYIFEVDIVDDGDEFIQITFGNGSVSFVDKECVEILGNGELKLGRLL
jgi:phosphotransferase system IIB component